MYQERIDLFLFIVNNLAACSGDGLKLRGHVIDHALNDAIFGHRNKFGYMNVSKNAHKKQRPHVQDCK